MKGLLKFAGMTLGSAVGWWLGAFVGITTAVLLSGLGGGAGLYLVHWLAERYLE
jgi:hypothetical protein